MKKTKQNNPNQERADQMTQALAENLNRNVIDGNLPVREASYLSKPTKLNRLMDQLPFIRKHKMGLLLLVLGAAFAQVLTFYPFGGLEPFGQWLARFILFFVLVISAYFYGLNQASNR